ncbi:hypothetical protein [Salana multivorans]
MTSTAPGAAPGGGSERDGDGVVVGSEPGVALTRASLPDRPSGRLSTIDARGDL